MDSIDVLLNESLSKYRYEIKISDVCHERLLQTTPVTKHTKCGRHIFLVHLITIMIICFIIPLSVYASSHAVTVIKDKVSETGMSEKEMENLYWSLRNQDFTDQDIRDSLELKVNENGLTYGPEAMGADLFAVSATNGKEGYCYRKDYEIWAGIKTPQEALEWQEKLNKWILYTSL